MRSVKKQWTTPGSPPLAWLLFGGLALLNLNFVAGHRWPRAVPAEGRIRRQVVKPKDISRRLIVAAAAA